MKKLKNLFVLFICAISLVACKSDDDLIGDWEIAQPFPAKARDGAVTFTIGDRVYVGLGLDEQKYEMDDFWVCNHGESWAKVAPFAGGARDGAVAFSDGTYGYVGLGWAERMNYQSGEVYFSDFWRFDPNGTTTITETDRDGNVVLDANGNPKTTTYTGEWTEVASAFPGPVRKYAIAFYVGGKAYVGTGEGKDTEGVYNDYYSFDPAVQQWDDSEVYVGQKRKGAVAWVIGNSAYVATGVQGSVDYVIDMWRFTPGKGWEELDKLKDMDNKKWDNEYGYIPRAYAVAFVVGSDENQTARAYLTTGSGGSASGLRVDTWEYNPYDGNDGMGRWDEVTGFPRNSGRHKGVAFVMNNQGFVTLGGYGNSLRQSTYKFWPGVENDEQNDD